MARLLYTDLRSREILGEIKASRFGFSEILSAPGSISFSGPLRQEAAGAPVLVTPENLVEGGSGLWVDLGSGVLGFGGIMWDFDPDVDTNTMTVLGEGFHSYARRRVLDHDLSFDGVDQAQIAHDLIADMQAVSGGDVGIVTEDPASPTGVLRDRSFAGYELGFYGDLVSLLAGVKNGFDFRYRPRYSSVDGEPEVAFEVLYPKTGRTTPLVFRLGENCSLASYRSTGRELANRTFATGAGTGPARIRSSAVDASALNERPLLEAVTSHPTVKKADTLAGHASRRLSIGRHPVAAIAVRLIPGHPEMKLGAFEIGDRVKFIGSHGRLVVDGFFRIVQIDAVFGDAEAVTVHLADVRSFQ